MNVGWNSNADVPKPKAGGELQGGKIDVPVTRGIGSG